MNGVIARESAHFAGVITEAFAVVMWVGQASDHLLALVEKLAGLFANCHHTVLLTYSIASLEKMSTIMFGSSQDCKVGIYQQ